MEIKDRENKYINFKKKYLGKKVDFDGAYGFQCVDLSKYYAKEVYGQILGNFGGSAYNGYLNEHNTFNNKWKQVPYQSGNIPIAGDILFWKPTNSNSYGHTAIAGVGSTIDKLFILEQNFVSENSLNFGKGTGSASISERVRDYKDFAGSYRFIG